MSDVRPMTDEEARMMRVIIDLRAQIQLLSDKALRFDLDAAGIELREKEAAELIELRAENERLRQDAERYRAIMRMVTVSPYSAGTYAYMLRVKGVTFETAIDAAMKEKNNES